MNDDLPISALERAHVRYSVVFIWFVAGGLLYEYNPPLFYGLGAAWAMWLVLSWVGVFRQLNRTNSEERND